MDWIVVVALIGVFVFCIYCIWCGENMEQQVRDMNAEMSEIHEQKMKEETNRKWGVK